MPNQDSPHVIRLHRYLPFDPSFDQIYEEYRHAKDTLELTTQALEYLKRLMDEGPSLVILTGDAGHGKTHLCSRIIRDCLGFTDDVGREILREKCNGDILEPRERFKSKKSVQIYKDFSEFSLPLARGKLLQAYNDETIITVICVNEGRLRSLLVDADDELKDLREQFNSSFHSGLVSAGSSTHIVNLNYQSVASPNSPLIDSLD